MKGARDLIEELDFYDIEEFYSVWWGQRVVALESVLADDIPVNFLELPEVQDCGLVTNDRVAALNEEAEMAGSGYLPRYGPDMWTVTTTDITHAYHLWRAGWPKTPRGHLVEWGGGYGNMARLVSLFPEQVDHVIIDTPVMLGLQRAYLDSHGIGATVAGVENFQRGVVLCATGLTHWLEAVEVDTFIGTFSVSECTRACHDYLIEKDWFGAKTVFLAVEPDKDLFAEAYGLKDRLLSMGFAEEPTHFPPSVYLRLDRSWTAPTISTPERRSSSRPRSAPTR